MDGFSIKNSQQFLQSGSIYENKSLRIDQPQEQSIFDTGSKNKNSNKTFADTLKEAVQTVNQLQKSSDQATQDLATGKTDNVANVMIAAEKADVALRVMVQVRNKIIDAYQEIMKMPV
jgi:flagellar hook-basal body complex protein FliE